MSNAFALILSSSSSRCSCRFIPPVADVSDGELFRVEMVDWTDGRVRGNNSADDIKSLCLSLNCASDLTPLPLNYISLRFSDLPRETMEIGMKENRENRYSYRYVVVFQYGSAVLFNITDHEAEQYLDIVRKHSS